MSLDVIARHKGKSDITDGFLEIIRQLGIWIESLTGTNPDAGFDSFSAANYNHGNRSEQADLIEEVILRLQEINSIGPGGGNGGGSKEDNRIRISAEDTVSKTWDELFGPTNEIQWGKIEADETFGERIRLLAKLCFTAGQRAYVGGIPLDPGKFNVIGEGEDPIAVFEINDGTLLCKVIFDPRSRMVVTGRDFTFKHNNGNFEIANYVGGIRLVDSSVVLNGILRHTVHNTPAAVQADNSLLPGEIVSMANGTLVRKL